MKNPIVVPKHYDYVAIFLTDRCPLRCSYCITEHNDTKFISGTDAINRLKPMEWIENLNRLELPAGVPLTFQGGEPFIYPGIWEVVEGVRHPVDILTALPASVKPARIAKWSHDALKRLNRGAPYPNIRVSYHPGQNKYEELIPRIKELQSIVSIGLYAVDHPANQADIQRAREMCAKEGVLFKTKEFLGFHDGQLYGSYRYPDASVGKVTRPSVMCKNSVVILAPDGSFYRCHSDLYHKRHELALGKLTDPNYQIRDEHQECKAYGMCSECDVKVKTNHEQKFGYTSVDIQFPDKQVAPKREVA